MGDGSASNLNSGSVEGGCAHIILSEGSILHTALYNLTGIEMKASNRVAVT